MTVLSIQLMLKQSMHLWNDQVMMFAMDRKMGLTVNYIANDQTKTQVHLTPKVKGPLTKRGSVRVWTVGLVVFDAVNVLVLFFAILGVTGVNPATVFDRTFR